MNLADILTARFAKGWRTYAVMAVLAAAFLLENVAGVDIPNFHVDWNTLVVALGLGAAANHQT